MTAFYLVRHAAHDLVDRVLVGRKIDIALNAHGKRQAEAVARQLAHERIAQVISSPRRRARQTAEPIAQAHGVSVITAPEIDEHDAGLWGGQEFDALKHDPHWRLWNERRAEGRPPGGESMRELQARVVSYFDRLAARWPADSIVLVTHAEPIRAVLLQERGLPLGAFLEVEVPIASITKISRAPAPSPAAEHA